jgi:hypothetical protein
MTDVLPDSRARVRRGIVRVVFAGEARNMVPIFCASCGAPQGLVEERFVTFAFMTCDECDRKYGVVAGVMCEPNAALWERVREAQERDPVRTPAELLQRLDDKSSIYAKIARDYRASISREL